MTGMVPATAYEMGLSSQDIFFHRTVIQGLTRLGQGKLFSRKRSGACAYCQRRIQVAVKRARMLALLPFVGR